MSAGALLRDGRHGRGRARGQHRAEAAGRPRAPHPSITRRHGRGGRGLPGGDIVCYLHITHIYSIFDIAQFIVRQVKPEDASSSNVCNRKLNDIVMIVFQYELLGSKPRIVINNKKKKTARRHYTDRDIGYSCCGGGWVSIYASCGQLVMLSSILVTSQ